MLLFLKFGWGKVLNKLFWFLKYIGGMFVIGVGLSLLFLMICN